jgi:hypothetical protein
MNNLFSPGLSSNKLYFMIVFFLYVKLPLLTTSSLSIIRPSQQGEVKRITDRLCGATVQRVPAGMVL